MARWSARSQVRRERRRDRIADAIKPVVTISALITDPLMTTMVKIIPIPVAIADNLMEYTAMDPGGAGVSREFSRRARWGRVSEVRMLDAVIHAMDERALRTTMAVVDHCRPSGNLTRPITTMGAVAASATPATNRVRRQNHTLGFIGRPASHTAPGPSKQNALTPKSKALPAAIRPGSNAISES